MALLVGFFNRNFSKWLQVPVSAIPDACHGLEAGLLWMAGRFWTPIRRPEQALYVTTIKTLQGDSSTKFEEVDLAHQRPKTLSLCL